MQGLTPVFDVEFFDDVLVIIVNASDEETIKDLVAEIDLLYRPVQRSGDKEAWKLLIIFSEILPQSYQTKIRDKLSDCRLEFAKPQNHRELF